MPFQISPCISMIKKQRVNIEQDKADFAYEGRKISLVNTIAQGVSEKQGPDGLHLSREGEIFSALDQLATEVDGLKAKLDYSREELGDLMNGLDKVRNQATHKQQTLQDSIAYRDKVRNDLYNKILEIINMLSDAAARMLQ